MFGFKNFKAKNIAYFENAIASGLDQFNINYYDLIPTNNRRQKIEGTSRKVEKEHSKVNPGLLLDEIQKRILPTILHSGKSTTLPVLEKSKINLHIDDSRIDRSEGDTKVFNSSLSPEDQAQLDLNETRKYSVQEKYRAQDIYDELSNKPLQKRLVNYVKMLVDRQSDNGIKLQLQKVLEIVINQGATEEAVQCINANILELYEVLKNKESHNHEKFNSITSIIDHFEGELKWITETYSSKINSILSSYPTVNLNPKEFGRLNLLKIALKNPNITLLELRGIEERVGILTNSVTQRQNLEQRSLPIEATATSTSKTPVKITEDRSNINPETLTIEESPMSLLGESLKGSLKNIGSPLDKNTTMVYNYLYDE